MTKRVSTMIIILAFMMNILPHCGEEPRNPKVSRAYNKQGMEYYHKKMYAKAIVEFENAQKHDRTFALPIFNKACTLAIMDRKEEAVEEIEKLYKLWKSDPKNKYAARNLRKARTDADLNSIRSMPDFQAILKKFERESVSYVVAFGFGKSIDIYKSITKNYNVQAGFNPGPIMKKVSSGIPVELIEKYNWRLQGDLAAVKIKFKDGTIGYIGGYHLGKYNSRDGFYHSVGYEDSIRVGCDQIKSLPAYKSSVGDTRIPCNF